MKELIFEVTQEADGGYVAECLTEPIVTQGDDWAAMRAAVDEAVRALKLCGIQNGVVNAGGDLRVFGKQSHTVLLRSPRQVNELIQIGSLQEGAIATSSNRTILHPRQGTTPLQGSYSVIAKECIYADALTKVLALSQDAHHPIFQNYGAESLWLPA